VGVVAGCVIQPQRKPPRGIRQRSQSPLPVGPQRRIVHISANIRTGPVSHVSLPPQWDHRMQPRATMPRLTWPLRRRGRFPRNGPLACPDCTLLRRSHRLPPVEPRHGVPRHQKITRMPQIFGSVPINAESCGNYAQRQKLACTGRPACCQGDWPCGTQIIRLIGDDNCAYPRPRHHNVHTDNPRTDAASIYAWVCHCLRKSDKGRSISRLLPVTI